MAVERHLIILMVLVQVAVEASLSSYNEIPLKIGQFGDGMIYEWQN